MTAALVPGKHPWPSVERVKRPPAVNPDLHILYGDGEWRLPPGTTPYPVPGPPGDNGASAYDTWLNLGNTGSEQAFIDSLKGTPGAAGPTGKSAYEEAVSSTGFIGSPAAWVASLKGERGDTGPAGPAGQSAYQVWRNLGNTGDEQAFINAIRGQNGTNGVDGKSAFEVAVSNNYQGSETEWLMSLVGPPGANGEAVNGRDGADGKSAYQIWLDEGNTGSIQDFLSSSRGLPGYSAYEVAVQQNFSGTVDQWLASLRGMSAYEVQVSEGYQGSVTQWLLSLRGPEGPQGEDGKSAYQTWLDLDNFGDEQDFIFSIGIRPQGRANTWSALPSRPSTNDMWIVDTDDTDTPYAGGVSHMVIWFNNRWVDMGPFSAGLDPELLEALEERLTELEGSVTNINTTVTGLGTTVNNLGTTVSNLSTVVSGNTSAITSLTNRVTVLEELPGVFEEHYTGADEPGLGENLLADGHSRVWHNPDGEETYIVTRLGNEYLLTPVMAKIVR